MVFVTLIVWYNAIVRTGSLDVGRINFSPSAFQLELSGGVFWISMSSSVFIRLLFPEERPIRSLKLRRSHECFLVLTTSGEAFSTSRFARSKNERTFTAVAEIGFVAFGIDDTFPRDGSEKIDGMNRKSRISGAETGDECELDAGGWHHPLTDTIQWTWAKRMAKGPIGRAASSRSASGRSFP
jgi:hypothetical protein